MTTAQVVETSVTVNNNSPIQDYVHPDDQTQPTFEMDNTIHQINLLPVDNAMTLVSLMNWIIFPLIYPVDSAIQHF